MASKVPNLLSSFSSFCNIFTDINTPGYQYFWTQFKKINSLPFVCFKISKSYNGAILVYQDKWNVDIKRVNGTSLSKLSTDKTENKKDIKQESLDRWRLTLNHWCVSDIPVSADTGMFYETATWGGTFVAEVPYHLHPVIMTAVSIRTLPCRNIVAAGPVYGAINKTTWFGRSTGHVCFCL